MIQRGNEFQQGKMEHNHPPAVGAATAARVLASVKEKAVDDQFKPASAIVTINYDHFVKTFIAHDGDKFTLPFSLLLRPTNKGEHGFYPVNSQTESITGVKCRELKFLININIFRALCRESRRRSRRKDGYVALP